MTDAATFADPVILSPTDDVLVPYAPEVVHIPIADSVFDATNLADYATDEDATDELTRLAAQRNAMLAAEVADIPDLEPAT